MVCVLVLPLTMAMLFNHSGARFPHLCDGYEYPLGGSVVIVK